jgi:prepilin-type N-terminal cleavage/methylation domain-containing protein
MRQRFEQGMTLMELLVAMVIGSLVITLVIRGLGMSLNLYERVADMTSTMDIAFRESHWWADSVASLVPCTDIEHCVEGNASAFSGFTLASVVHAPGMRMPVTWEIARVDGRATLQLKDGPATEDQRVLVMTLAIPESARFAYLAPDGQWLDEWGKTVGNKRLPVAIRIEDSEGNIWAVADTAQRPYGRGDYRDIVGMQ